MLELEGIYAPSYEISFLKVTIYHHPEKYGREIKVVFNIVLEMLDGKSNMQQDRPLPKKLEVFINTGVGVEVVKLEDLSYKINEDYAANIGACWTPGEDKKEHKYKVKKLKITNISENKKDFQKKFPYIDIKSGRIKLHLEFEEEEMKNNNSNNEKVKDEEDNDKNKGMIFFALYLKGDFLEEDHWLKKIFGLSSHAWEFSYVFWSHNEKSLIPAQSVGECKEAQTFIIIPKKMVKSINRVSCMPGNDQLHEMTDNDISTFCESENSKKKIENIKKWVEPGSYSLAWKIPNTLKLSKKIVLGHLDAYPRSANILLFSFLVFLCLTYLFTSGQKLKETLVPLLVIFVILFFFISAINYSFHNIRQSQISRGLYETGGIVLICFLLSLGLYGPVILKSLIEKSLSISEISPDSWLLMLFPTLLIFIFVSYRKEKGFYSPQDSKLTPTIIIIFHCIVIFLISAFLAYSVVFLGTESSGSENYSKILEYWVLNNLYATIGIKGSHKLIEL